ncbi:MAG: sensor histidine kinase [Calditrichaeota bacterium]|nr:MAG: sensor histidine kinase [Calditrichota bacterium]
MFSIKSKINLAYTLVFGVLIISFSFVIYKNVEQILLNEIDANLKSFFVILDNEIEDALIESKGDFEILYELKNQKPQGLEKAGFQLYSPQKQKIIPDSILQNLTEIVSLEEKLVNGEPNNLFQIIEIDGEKFRVLWILLELHADYENFIEDEENDIFYTLQLYASMENIDSKLNKLIWIFSLAIPLGLLFTAFLSFFLSKAAFKPILQMAETAENISAQSLDLRLELPEAKDEIRNLAETLNKMIARIDDTFKSQKQFIANASHEFRTPLTIIQAELELAEKQTENEDLKESLKIALSEIDNLTNLTISLLTLTKLDAFQLKLHKKQIRLDELLIDVYQSFKALAESKNINLNLEISEAVEILADQEKLKQVLFNLLNNALKYSSENGEISLSLNKISEQKIEVIVSDNGLGILEEELPFVFKRFFRSKETRSNIQGSGLGLAIVKELVELHDGEILVESKIGKGTKVIVSLPIT